MRRRWTRKSLVVVLGCCLAALGLPIAPTAFAAPGATNPITYVYDEAGRLTAVVDPTAASKSDRQVRL